MTCLFRLCIWGRFGLFSLFCWLLFRWRLYEICSLLPCAVKFIVLNSMKTRIEFYVELWANVTRISMQYQCHIPIMYWGLSQINTNTCSTATETYPKLVFFTLKKIKGFCTLIKKSSTSEKKLRASPQITLF